MLLLIDDKEYFSLLNRLNISYDNMTSVTLSNVSVCKENHNLFYFTITFCGQKQSFNIIEIDYYNIWKLDTIFGANNIFRVNVIINNSEATVNFDECNDASPVFFYTKNNTSLVEADTEAIIDALSSYHQLQYCDAYLMIPGYLNVMQDSIENSFSEDYFCKIIKKRLEDETEESFIQDIFRFNLGSIDLIIESDVIEKKRFSQRARLYLVWHKPTGFCILEFMVLNCCIGGNKLNNYFGGNGFSFRLNGYQYNYIELLELFEIKLFGNKRSLMFAYGDVEKKEIINALANEEYAMGEIKGKFAELAYDDIAIYDTAEVYVSQTTMFELCKQQPNTIYDRVSYQSIELFFVELLLFQDASVDKTYKDLRQLQKDEAKNKNYEKTIEKLDELNEELTTALIFSDYDYFLFPTTRMSSKRISEAFGLFDIYEKYKQNIDILKGLVESNKRKSDKKQDRIKNKFLFLLTFLSALGTFGEIIYVAEKRITPLNAYVLASFIILLTYSIYKILMTVGEKNDRKTNGKTKRKNRKK